MPLQTLQPGQVAKIKIALAMSEHHNPAGAAALAQWEEHAHEAGFASLDSWLAYSERLHCPACGTTIEPGHGAKRHELNGSHTIVHAACAGAKVCARCEW